MYDFSIIDVTAPLFQIEMAGEEMRHKSEA